MLGRDIELQGGLAAGAVPDWLMGLVRAVRQQGLQPRDSRVKTLWNLLRQRALLTRSPWLQARLRYIWRQGLTARPRPRTAQRLVRLLRAWGILRPRRALRRVPIRPLRAVAARPAAVRRLMPVVPKRVFRPVMRK